MLFFVAALGVGGGVYYLATRQPADLAQAPGGALPPDADLKPKPPDADPKPKPPDLKPEPPIGVAWPADALAGGLIHAPKWTDVKPLLRDTFADPMGGFPKGAKRYDNGKYVLHVTRTSAETADVPVSRVSPPAGGDFAIEVVAEATGYVTRWGIVIVDHDHPKELAQAVLLLGTGRIYAGPDPGAAPQPQVYAAAVHHPLLPQANKFGSFRGVLQVVVKGGNLEAYVDGVAVIQPLVLERTFTAPRFRLAAATYNAKGNDAKFESITIWPADSLAPLETRVAIAKKLEAAPK
jgi:hypothetical protein